MAIKRGWLKNAILGFFLSGFHFEEQCGQEDPEHPEQPQLHPPLFLLLTMERIQSATIATITAITIIFPTMGDMLSTFFPVNSSC